MFRTKYIIYFVDFLFLFVFNLFLLSFELFRVSNIPVAALFAVAVVLGLYAFRCYDSQSLSVISESIIRIIFGTAFGFIGILIFYPLIHTYINNLTFAFNGIFIIILLPLVHKIEYHSYLDKRSATRYLILGKSEGMDEVLNDIEAGSLNKIKFVGTCPTAGASEQLDRLSVDYDAALIMESHFPGEAQVIEKLKSKGKKVLFLPHLSERVLKRIPIPVALRFEEYYNVFFNSIEYDPTKRLMDILVSLVALLLFFPLMLLIALIILIEDGAPVILKQQRMGKNCNLFRMFKFRSLAELDKNEKNPNDNIEQRVLKSGRVIRKLRLDETMQFINVLLGEMSIVGSRPEMIQFHEQSSERIPFYNYRLKCNPGITGWAQINYKHTSSIDDYRVKTEYDLYYVKNRNIFLDLKIMLQTIEAMLGMRGAR